MEEEVGHILPANIVSNTLMSESTWGIVAENITEIMSAKNREKREEHRRE